MGTVLSKFPLPVFSAPGVMKLAGRFATISLITVFLENFFKSDAWTTKFPIPTWALVSCSMICPMLWAMIYPLVPLKRLPLRIWSALRQRSTWPHTLTELLKMGAEMEQRSNLMGDSFVDGLKLPRPWLWVSAMYTYIIAAAPFLPGISNDAEEQHARAFLALGALYMDPVVGNLIKRILVKVKSLLAFKLHHCLSHLGVAEYRWTYPILKAASAVASVLVINWFWPKFSEFVQTWLLVRRANYDSWSDPDLWLSLAIRYTIYISIFLLFRVTRKFKAARQHRILEEGYSGPGTPVFASQYAVHGAAKHQILIVGDVKHELTISRDGAAHAQYKHMPFNINHDQRLLAREQGLLTLQSHYIYLVGWTQHEPHHVISICNAKISNWIYNITTHNCQHFIREVADEITNVRASDWIYFREGQKTAYQKWLLSGWKFRLPLMSAWYIMILIALKPWENKDIISSEPGLMVGSRIGRWMGFSFASMYLTRFIFGRYI